MVSGKTVRLKLHLGEWMYSMDGHLMLYGCGSKEDRQTSSKQNNY